MRGRRKRTNTKRKWVRLWRWNFHCLLSKPLFSSLISSFSFISFFIPSSFFFSYHQSLQCINKWKKKQKCVCVCVCPMEEINLFVNIVTVVTNYCCYNYHINYYYYYCCCHHYYQYCHNKTYITVLGTFTTLSKPFAHIRWKYLNNNKWAVKRKKK